MQKGNIITCGKNTTLEWEDRDWLAAPANGEEFDRLSSEIAYSSRESSTTVVSSCLHSALTRQTLTTNQDVVQTEIIPTFGKRDTES